MTDGPDILRRMEQGDPRAAGELLPLVYDQLRRLAARRLARETPGQTLDATDLVHQAYLRLVGGDREQDWNGRRHFFGAAAEAMRRILVERARHKRRLRHGGGRKRIDLERLDLVVETVDDRLLELDEALDRLAQEEPDVAALFKLRYFTGLPIPQAAEALGISVRTAHRNWAYARTRLYELLHVSPKE